jgi:uncharacterized protein YhbP (UPF0306 family)
MMLLKVHQDQQSKKYRSLVPPIYTSPFPTQQILDSAKLKEFANKNLKFDENGIKLSKRVFSKDLY